MFETVQRKCPKFLKNNHEAIQIVGIALFAGAVEYVTSGDSIRIAILVSLGFILIGISIVCEESSESHEFLYYARKVPIAISLGAIAASIILFIKGAILASAISLTVALVLPKIPSTIDWVIEGLWWR